MNQLKSILSVIQVFIIEVLRKFFDAAQKHGVAYLFSILAIAYLIYESHGLSHRIERLDEALKLATVELAHCNTERQLLTAQVERLTVQLDMLLLKTARTKK